MNQAGFEKPKPNRDAVNTLMDAFSEFKDAHKENLDKRDKVLNDKIEELYEVVPLNCTT